VAKFRIPEFKGSSGKITIKKSTALSTANTLPILLFYVLLEVLEQ